MKKILLILAAILILSSAMSYAQKYTYRTECGNDVGTVIYNRSDDADGIHFYCDHGQTKYWQTLNKNYETLDWRVVNSAEDTDIKAVAKDGKIVIKGKFKGKQIDRSEDRKGQPWYQQIGISGGHILKAGETVKFVCLRPTDMDTFFLTATEMGETEFRGMKVHRVKMAPAGAFAKLWSSDYYYDSEDLSYAGYKAVEGGPGTPTTYWILISKK